MDRIIVFPIGKHTTLHFTANSYCDESGLFYLSFDLLTI